jgi:hypothetical protein
MVMLRQETTVEEAKALGLTPGPGDSIFKFSPTVGELFGPHGICIIHSGRVIQFRIRAISG